MGHSKRYVLLIFLIQLSACPNALSEPEVPGAKINPVEYLNPTVFLAARLDTSRASVKSLEKWARHVIHESALTDKESSYAKSYLQGDKCDDWLTAFKEHGGRFIYQFTGPPNIRDHGTFWVFPLAEKGKLEAMRAWIEELAGPPQPGIVVADPCQSVIRNQTVMFASRLQLEVLNRAAAKQRQWAEEAFNEVKDAPLAVVYVQNPWLWEMFPSIPKDTPALRDILWVAADVTFEPEPHVRLTACIDDAKTPVEVRREVIEQIAIATRDMNLQPDDAKVFSSLLSPNVAGRKLVIDLDSQSLSQLGRVLLPPWLHEELREKT